MGSHAVKEPAVDIVARTHMLRAELLMVQDRDLTREEVAVVLDLALTIARLLREPVPD
jgi:hypothetical protein